MLHSNKILFMQDMFKWPVCDSKLTCIFETEGNLESAHF